MGMEHKTKKRRRSRHTQSIEITEYRWTCTCGMKSVWFPTAERRDAMAANHERRTP